MTFLVSGESPFVLERLEADRANMCVGPCGNSLIDTYTAQRMVGRVDDGPRDVADSTCGGCGRGAL